MISRSKQERRELTNRPFQNQVERRRETRSTCREVAREEWNTSGVLTTRSLSRKVLCYSDLWWGRPYTERKGSLILSSIWAWMLQSNRILEKTKLCYAVFVICFIYIHALQISSFAYHGNYLASAINLRDNASSWYIALVWSRRERITDHFKSDALWHSTLTITYISKNKP